MDAAAALDRQLIRELVDNWVVWRDAGDWDGFRSVWHDDGWMMATWTQGSFEHFIQMTIDGWAGTSRSCTSRARTPPRSRATAPSPRPR